MAGKKEEARFICGTRFFFRLLFLETYERKSTLISS
jgi:hypothetical protein